MELKHVKTFQKVNKSYGKEEDHPTLHGDDVVSLCLEKTAVFTSTPNLLSQERKIFISKDLIKMSRFPYASLPEENSNRRKN